MAAMTDSNDSDVSPLARDLIDKVKTWYFKTPQRNKSGGLSSYIQRTAEDFTRIRFQATAADGDNLCSAPFGISEPYDKQNKQALDSNKRNFELAMYSEDLKRFIRELDRVTLETTIKNYDNWLNNGDKKRKSLTPEEIKMLYRPLYQEGDPEKGYADTFRTKVIVNGPSSLRVLVYVGRDSSGNAVLREGSLADIEKFSKVVPIIEIVGMWFMTKQFGLSLSCKDVVVYPKTSNNSGFNFGGAKLNIIHNDADIHPAQEVTFNHLPPRGPAAQSQPPPQSQPQPQSQPVQQESSGAMTDEAAP